ncbi:LolA-like protein [Nocardioides marmoraquaticus]
MVPAARWLLVLAVAVVLAGAPVLVRAWPVEPSDLDAPALADAVRDAYDTGWSGEVYTQGSVEIPESDSDLDGVARLLGESSTLRVWWRSPDEHRVDRLRTSGETDILRAGDVSVRWRYEGNRVTVTFDDDLRLPDDPDVVPVALARRLLAGVTDDELSRLPDERVAGRPAAGLRVVPSDPRSTLDRIDLWADQDSGVPLRVEVYGVGETSPALVSTVTDLDLRRPTTRQAQIEFTRGVEVSRGRGFEARADGFFVRPDRIAGLPLRADAEVGDAGVYGRGATSTAVIPVRDSVARGLREQLRRVAATIDTGARQAVAFGPVSVVLTQSDEQALLLVGTVTLPTLQQAADELEVRR